MKIGIIIVLFLVSVINAKAQDIHFSQFDVNVTSLNPAHTGVLQRDFRVANNYKNQWGSVGLPYTTFSVAYDMNLLKQRAFKKGLSDIGVGFSFSQDKAGISKWSQNQFNLSLSAIQEVGRNTKMSLGLQTSYAQNSVMVDDLSWDNQFVNHEYDETMPTRESFANSAKTYIDLSGGILVESRITESQIFTGGIAYFHINKPVYTLFSNDRLPSKLVVHASYETPIGGALSMRRLVPKFMYVKQGKHNEVLLGALYRSVMKESSSHTTYANETYIDFGAYYRVRIIDLRQIVAPALCLGFPHQEAYFDRHVERQTGAVVIETRISVPVAQCLRADNHHSGQRFPLPY